MKNTVINIFASLILFFSLIQGTADAQCLKTLVNRTGTVYAGGPAKQTFTATGSTVTVTVAKTDGRAQTIVNIYVDNQRKKFITFNNGNYTSTKSATVSGTLGKKVRIEIVNQSVGNKFSYRLTCKSAAPASLGNASGTLVGQTKKTLNFDRVCTSKNRINISIRRTSGNARATVIVKKNGRQIDSKVLNNNQNVLQLAYGNAGGARYQVELKNVSVGNRIGYRISGTQRN